MNANPHGEMPLTRAELERLAADPRAAADWEEHQRMEDALRPVAAPAGLHARIMSRIDAEPMPDARVVALPRRNTWLVPALVAATLALAVAGGLRFQRERDAEVRSRNEVATLTSLPRPSFEIPADMLNAAAPARLEAEGRELGRIAGSIVEQAASPLRGAASLAQGGGESSSTTREPSS